MYVRDARNRDEVWLLDHLEEMDLDESAFRSRDFVIATDERDGTKVGFGRLRIHTGEDEEVCELTSLGVLEHWRNQGVGAHVVERLVEMAAAQNFDSVYALMVEPGYLQQFGFEPIEASALPPVLAKRREIKQADSEETVVPVVLDVEDFSMPHRLRESFKTARDVRTQPEEEPDPETDAEEFGIDPDEATYKYDVE